MPPAAEPPSALHRRDPGLRYPADFSVAWHPAMPEFAIAANAVSMLMPHAEPYVVKAVRAVADELPDELAARARGYIGQEISHHREHHRFNQLLLTQHPGLGRVDRWARRTYQWLWNSRSERFHLAFAAGFETVAYAAARWTARRRGSLFTGADPTGARLFQWHLAEEVEHKSVAYDVYYARHTSRLALAGAMLVSSILLAWFSVLATLGMLWSTRRIFNPVAHVRLAIWTISFTFELLPAMGAACLRDHHPEKMVDPAYFEQWLRELDLESPATSVAAARSPALPAGS
ncbi:MAG: hypothetical protein HKN26_09045 [Acidimicrobiales bacterium]|nr:hypothetical protein [Acidimicrobiales bacterium]